MPIKRPFSKAIGAGAADFIAKPIERDIFICTVRRTLNLSRLRALLERRQAVICRAREHYLSLVQKLAQSNERWISSLNSELKAYPGSLPHDALIVEQNTMQRMETFTKRATRHWPFSKHFFLTPRKTITRSLKSSTWLKNGYAVSP